MLTVIGEALIDLVGSPSGVEFRAHPGGSPLNVAVGLARLDRRVLFRARIAGDAFGRLLRAHAVGNGVDLALNPLAVEPTTLAVVTLSETGSASYDFYIDGTADWQWTAEELIIPDTTQILHFGSLASWMPPGDEVIRAVVTGRRDLLVTYDPNVRPRLLGDPERGQRLVARNVAMADVVKTSDEDLAWLYPGAAPADVAERWLANGRTWLVVVTQGPGGAVAYWRGGEPMHRPARPVAVVDTVGAGDACMAGLLAGLDRGGVRGPNDVDVETLAAIVDDALLVASLTCTRAGADPPTSAELAAAR